MDQNDIRLDYFSLLDLYSQDPTKCYIKLEFFLVKNVGIYSNYIQNDMLVVGNELF